MPNAHLILASASPARLATLRSAGVEPTVVVSGLDESEVDDPDPAALALRLAELKGRAVAGGPALAVARAKQVRRTVVVACDSVLEIDGLAFGKPRSADEATERLTSMRGRTGVLHTGHFVSDLESGHALREVAATLVRFGSPTDIEIAAYVGTGEPLNVAGAFTIDGLGGPFIDGVDGDHHNVTGLSLPLLRRMLAELGILWSDLW